MDNAKNYLYKIIRLQDIYDEKVLQLQELKARCTAVNSPMAAGERVQSSPNLHGKEEVVCNAIDFENQLKKDLEELIELQIDITNKVNGMDDEHRLILTMRYLNGKRFERIACDLDKSLRGVYKMHKRALRSFEEKYMGGQR